MKYQTTNDAFDNLIIMNMSIIFADSKSSLWIRKKLNISEDIYEKVRNLSLNDFNSFCLTSNLEISLDTINLNFFIQKVEKKENLNCIENKAIILGASRKNMYELSNMSNEEFKTRRNILLIDENRKRPEVLDIEEVNTIKNILQNHYYKNLNSRLEKIVFISQKTGIEINRILKYYFDFYNFKIS